MNIEDELFFGTLHREMETENQSTIIQPGHNNTPRHNNTAIQWVIESVFDYKINKFVVQTGTKQLQKEILYF